MYCSKCGQNNVDEAAFCVSCGEPLNQTQQQPEQPSAAQQTANVYYQPAPQQPQQPGQTQPKPGQGMAVASMVLGIVSLFCAAIITGILAIIFGGVAKSKGNKSGMATAGIVLGIIGIVLYIILLAAMPSYTEILYDIFG